MTGIIILAAGQSARLGTPKQNLIYKGNTLLQHTINAALQSVCKPIIVVLGAYAADILPTIDAKDIEIIRNDDWEEGMASSIRASITALQKHPDIDSALIMLCDQPHVDALLLKTMIHRLQDSHKGIIACAYNGTLGVPVLFNKQYFAGLLLLTGHDGAKKILAAHLSDIAAVPFPLGAVDIDTMADYTNLSNLP